MNIIDKTVSYKESLSGFNENINSAIDDIGEYVESDMLKSSHIVVIAAPTCVNNNEDNHPASELYLTLTLSGYGSIKTEFKNILIGTGIIEGIAQGVIVSSATQNLWLGLGVATEEFVSEYLSWNGVDWILGETFAPVSLDGSLVYLQDNKVIWQDSYFVTENEEELSDDDKKDKSKQLKASLHKVEYKLVSNLNDYLQKEVVPFIGGL